MRRAAGLAGLLLLVLAGSADAAPLHWRTADFPLPGDAEVLAADLAADGDAVVALTLGPQLAVLERRAPAGAWGAAKPLTTDNGDRFLKGRRVVRLNERGEALAVWVTAPAGRVVAARRTADGRWSQAVPVGIGDVRSSPGLVRVALGKDGRAWIATDSPLNGASIINVAGQDSAAAPWHALAPELILPTPTSDVAVNGRGEAVTAWAGPVFPGRTDKFDVAVFAAALGAAGWSDREQVAPVPPLDYVPNVAVDIGDGGRSALAWTLSTFGGGAPEAEAAIREAGAGWSAPVVVNPTPIFATDAAVAVGPNGVALATWREGTAGGAGAATAAIAPPGRDFEGTSTFFAPGVRQAFSKPLTPFVTADAAVDVVQVEGARGPFDAAGAPAPPVAFATALAGAPEWRSIAFPAWTGSDPVFAFSASGAGLAAGTIDPPPLEGAGGGVMRIAAYDDAADPARPRVTRVALVGTARGRALALSLSRPARLSARFTARGGAGRPIAIGPRSLRAGRHLLPVRGLTAQSYRRRRPALHVGDGVSRHSDQGRAGALTAATRSTAAVVAAVALLTSLAWRPGLDAVAALSSGRNDGGSRSSGARPGGRA